MPEHEIGPRPPEKQEQFTKKERVRTLLHIVDILEHPSPQLRSLREITTERLAQITAKPEALIISSLTNPTLVEFIKQGNIDLKDRSALISAIKDCAVKIQTEIKTEPKIERASLKDRVLSLVNASNEPLSINVVTASLKVDRTAVTKILHELLEKNEVNSSHQKLGASRRPAQVFWVKKQDEQTPGKSE